ncbi:MAG: tetratricopeptide repeat protein [Acidobacteria bacterium]|nr:tetratricopeptide repeat protein [Acidobacteriota bacterium]
MNVGIPGTGVGGLFYLLSALWMPFCEARRAVRGRSTSSSRSVVKRQAFIAAGILAGIGAMFWLLGVAVAKLTAFAATTGVETYIQEPQELPRFLTYSALALSVATLVMVLTSVQLLRLVVRPRQVHRQPEDSREMASSPTLFAFGRRIALVALFILFPTTATQALNGDTVAEHLTRADTALADEDSVTAEREYHAALQLEPDNSRATFRLAQLLEKKDWAESERFFRRYIELEPTDPWGYIALGDFFVRAGQYEQALPWYAEAVQRAPRERDAILGQARALGRSGRIDPAIELYEQWLGSHPEDGEAWRELARERGRAGQPKGALAALEQASAVAPDNTTEGRWEYFRHAAAPAIEPGISFSRDSDGNLRRRITVGGNFAVKNGARLGVTVGRVRVADGSENRDFSEFSLTTHWRPRAAFELNATGGAVRLDATRNAAGTQRPTTFISTAHVRARATAPEGIARFDIQFDRNLVDSTPLLVANRIVRNEVRLRPEFALSRRFRVRAMGGAGSIHGGGERNSRYTVGGGAGWNLSPAVELSANYAQIRYAHPSHVGYFAPDRIQTVDFGSYMEFEGHATLVALDFGGGMERLREHGSVFGPWRPSLRAYALLSFTLQPGRELRFEVEGYSTQAGPALAPISGWKYGSAAVSFRWALP